MENASGGIDLCLLPKSDVEGTHQGLEVYLPLPPAPEPSTTAPAPTAEDDGAPALPLEDTIQPLEPMNPEIPDSPIPPTPPAPPAPPSTPLEVEHHLPPQLDDDLIERSRRADEPIRERELDELAETAWPQGWGVNRHIWMTDKDESRTDQPRIESWRGNLVKDPRWEWDLLTDE